MSAAQYTAEIARLIQQQGAERAAAAERSGQVWGGALANLGQIPAQMQRQKAEKQQLDLRGQEIAIRGQELDQRTKAFAQELIDKKQAHDDQAIGQIGSFIHESGNTLEALQSGLQSAKRAGLLSDEEIAPILAGAQEDPNRVKLLARGMMSRTKEGRDRLEKTTTVKAGDTVLGFEGKPVFQAPPEAPKNPTELAMAAQDPSLPQTERAAAALAAVQAPTEELRKETARHNAELERISGLTQGRMEAAATETARHNKAMEAAAMIRANRPATGAKVRPVTSGDAGRVTEFDTSLDDLARMREALSATKSTGAAAQVGAAVPNFVTEFTGWGEDAKKKQALINRVKQVIGKALEGGVLRKEDELKYEKILPTIGDPNPVVMEKLNGLESAISQRRVRLLENLSDAGYDTSKFDAKKISSSAPANKNPFR